MSATASRAMFADHRSREITQATGSSDRSVGARLGDSHRKIGPRALNRPCVPFCCHVLGASQLVAASRHQPVMFSVNALAQKSHVRYAPAFIKAKAGESISGRQRKKCGPQPICGAKKSSAVITNPVAVIARFASRLATETAMPSAREKKSALQIAAIVSQNSREGTPPITNDSAMMGNTASRL